MGCYRRCDTNDHNNTVLCVSFKLLLWQEKGEKHSWKQLNDIHRSVDNLAESRDRMYVKLPELYSKFLTCTERDSLVWPSCWWLYRVLEDSCWSLWPPLHACRQHRTFQCFPSLPSLPNWACPRYTSPVRQGYLGALFTKGFFSMIDQPVQQSTFRSLSP